jgi:hypothetical protein
MDHRGNIWINRHSIRRQPLTRDEILAMDDAIADFIDRNGPGLDAQDTVN